MVIVIPLYFIIIDMHSVSESLIQWSLVALESLSGGPQGANYVYSTECAMDFSSDYIHVIS